MRLFVVYIGTKNFMCVLLKIGKDSFHLMSTDCRPLHSKYGPFFKSVLQSLVTAKSTDSNFFETPHKLQQNGAVSFDIYFGQVQRFLQSGHCWVQFESATMGLSMMPTDNSSRL